MESRWLKIKKSREKIITHNDWKSGLTFRVIYQDNNEAILLVCGGKTAIDKYQSRFAQVTELTDSTVQTTIDALAPKKQIKCPVCGNLYTPKGFDVSQKTDIVNDLAKNREVILTKYKAK